MRQLEFLERLEASRAVNELFITNVRLSHNGYRQGNRGALLEAPNISDAPPVHHNHATVTDRKDHARDQRNPPRWSDGIPVSPVEPSDASASFPQ
ncbi:hypothetical protein RRF57_005088 [Xylaria bambusicola]|uniref:Uncharacterized protein n=1 Tax=Xylaria bambusicola TaxID=326684 RepID=A0AAN7ULC1_9PEZI